MTEMCYVELSMIQERNEIQMGALWDCVVCQYGHSKVYFWALAKECWTLKLLCRIKAVKVSVSIRTFGKTWTLHATTSRKGCEKLIENCAHFDVPARALMTGQRVLEGARVGRAKFSAKQCRFLVDLCHDYEVKLIAHITPFHFQAKLESKQS